MQWIEKLPYEVDVKSLVKNLNEIKQIGPMIMQGSEFGYNNFGGWNLQSRSGDYRDGFQVGIEKCYRKNGTFNYHLAKFLNYSHGFEHKNKTNACIDAFSEIVDFLELKGFYPRRMRLTCLKPHSKSIVHRDSPSSKYLARIHIPLITNEKCIHWTEYGETHMPADGSVYMLWVNCMHQIRNDSDEERYHIICDAYDTKGITQNFKYDKDINLLIKESEIYRQRIDETKNSFIRNLFYKVAVKIYMIKFKIEQKKLKQQFEA